MQANLPHIKLDQFEGPFDLLIELARARELPLAEISLYNVTDAFLEYVRERALAPELLGDFLVVAATLLLLKVKLLLPKLNEEEAEEVAELTGRLRVYAVYREAAQWVGKRWREPMGVSRRGVYKGEVDEISAGILAETFAGLITHLPKPATVRAHLTRQGKSLPEILLILNRRLSAWRTLTFERGAAGLTRQETAVAFLAVLELVRRGEASLTQRAAFEEMTIETL